MNAIIRRTVRSRPIWRRICRRWCRWKKQVAAILFTCCFMDSSSSRYTPRSLTTPTGEIISESISTYLLVMQSIQVPPCTESNHLGHTELKTARSTPTRQVGHTTGKSISHAGDVLWSTAVAHLWIVNTEVWLHLKLISDVNNVFCVRYKLEWSQHGSLRDATIHLIAGSILTVIEKRLRSTTEIRLEP